MKERSCSSTEGKKNLASVLRDVEKKGERFIITRRKKPVAVIIPYDIYVQDRKKRSWDELLELRKELVKTNLSATSLVEESREELENRQT